MTDECEKPTESTAQNGQPPAKRGKGDVIYSNKDQDGNSSNHKSSQEKSSLQEHSLGEASKSSKDQMLQYDGDRSSEYESSEEDKSGVKASDMPAKDETTKDKYADIIPQSTKLNAVTKWLDLYYDLMISNQSHYWPVTNPNDRFGSGDGTPWPHPPAPP